MYVRVTQTFHIASPSPRNELTKNIGAHKPDQKQKRCGLGEFVQVHRLQQRLTVSALAEKVQISVLALARIERGDEVPSHDILERLRRILHIPA